MNSVTSFFQGNSALMALMCIYMILAYSQYLFLKAGVFCFSTAGSAAIGAYATGYLSTQGMSSWLTVPLAVVFATTATLILGASLFRVRGISLGIASIAFVLGIVSLLYVIPSVSGGALGLLGISPWATLPVLFVFLVATSLLMWRIDKSEYGMRLDAMRCDEVAAMGIGLGTDNLRLSVFALSGALGGLGGALLAHNAFAIFPTQFSFELMISVLLYAVVGGVRHWWGAAAGVVLLLVIAETARVFGEIRPYVMGLALILAVLLMPGGLSGVWHGFMQRRLAKRESERTPPGGSDQADTDPVQGAVR